MVREVGTSRQSCVLLCNKVVCLRGDYPFARFTVEGGLVAPTLTLKRDSCLSHEGWRGTGVVRCEELVSSAGYLQAFYTRTTTRALSRTPQGGTQRVLNYSSRSPQLSVSLSSWCEKECQKRFSTSGFLSHFLSGISRWEPEFGSKTTFALSFSLSFSLTSDDKTPKLRTRFGVILGHSLRFSLPSSAQGGGSWGEEGFGLRGAKHDYSARTFPVPDSLVLGFFSLGPDKRPKGREKPPGPYRTEKGRGDIFNNVSRPKRARGEENHPRRGTRCLWG